MRRALILVLASVTWAKDDPPQQCATALSCLAAGDFSQAVAIGAAQAAKTLSKDKNGPLAKVAGASISKASQALDTSEKPNDGTCHKKKGKVCVEGEIVVETAQGSVCRFVKYGKRSIECRNAHNELKKPLPGGCRRATPAEAGVFKDDVDAFERWKKGGKNGEEPKMRKVAKFAEGPTVDEKEIEAAKDQMVGIIDLVAFSGDGQPMNRGDPLSVLVNFDQCISRAIPGRGREYDRKTLEGSSPAKRKQLRDAQVALLEEYEKEFPAEMKEKNKMMSDRERLRRAEAKQKAAEAKREEQRKKSNQVALTEWSSEDGTPVKRKSGEIKPSHPGYFLEDTVSGSRTDSTAMKSCLMKAFGGEEGVKKKAPELLKPIFG